MVRFPLQTVPTDYNLLHSRQNLKQTKRMCEMNNIKWRQFADHIVYI